VRVEADGPIRLVDVSAQRAACALWRAGVLRGQRITYGFDWPARPGVSLSVDIAEGACGPAGLQEALAFAAVAGLNASEASLLTRPFGYSVVGVERRYGSAVFFLSPDLVYVVPLVVEAQLPSAGKLFLVNPSNVTVVWRVEFHVAEEELSSGVQHGTRVGALEVELPPYSTREVYLFGSARVGGLYAVSYVARVVGDYSWGGYTFHVDGRVATRNGSILNWLWGGLERLAGAVMRNECLNTRGEGRMWAA